MQTLFKPKMYPVRQPTDNKRRNGQVLNPPRLPEIGGMTLQNADDNEGSLRLQKIGDAGKRVKG